MSDIHFGTDGWRAVIGQDFTYESVHEAATAIAEVFAQDAPTDLDDVHLLVGYDMRFEADAFAAAVAEVLAQRGFEVRLSDRPIPTPGLCCCIALDEQAIGGVMLTASHNPSAWLGIKVRMADGGASPSTFTDRIEHVLEAAQDESRAKTPSGASRTDLDKLTAECDCALQSLPPSSPGSRPPQMVDLVDQYLDHVRASMREFAPPEPVEATPIKIVIDPMFGAGQELLAELMREQEVEVVEIHAERNPGFGGLHPEPIPPWTDQAAEAVIEHGASAAFLVDGDGDRIGAIDENGNFVSPHRILALLAQHLVEDLGRDGRIIKTLALSNTIDRLGAQLGKEVEVRPIGFKWVYEEMLKGDVLIGGEESGGIGIAQHVRERDGLLMALLLLQMMRVRGKTLGQLVNDLLDRVGTMYYLRRDLTLDEETAQRFRTDLVHSSPTQMAGRPVREIERLDGLKLHFDDDEWLLLRGSGTEPLIRIYAEANTPEQMTAYLDAGSAFVQGESVS
ncbi:MAG: phosphoglucosamine mutase [Actinomycetia bacterium]|nr:phosphoglucosamine mutase [Actinomycetes bacterium]